MNDFVGNAKAWGFDLVILSDLNLLQVGKSRVELELLCKYSRRHTEGRRLHTCTKLKLVGLYTESLMKFSETKH